MVRQTVSEIFDIYNRRTELLGLVCNGTLDKRTAQERVDCSRPTIDRSFRELEELGVVTSVGTTYELTKFGQLLCEEFTRTRATVSTLADLSDVLSDLPDDCEIDMQLLDGASVRRAAEHAPQEPFLDIVDVADGASAIRGYSSTVMPSYVDAFASLVLEDEVPATFAFTTDVVETLARNYPDRFEQVRRADHVEIHEIATTSGYGLLVVDDTVAVPVGGDGGGLAAVIVNDSDGARAWADDRFEALLSDAETATA
jgi:predicted transcriptional regulator